MKCVKINIYAEVKTAIFKMRLPPISPHRKGFSKTSRQTGMSPYIVITGSTANLCRLSSFHSSVRCYTFAGTEITHDL